MRRILVRELNPGMVLGRTIYNDNGDILLRRGVELSPAYIESLDRRGFTVVYVCDGVADDIEPVEIVSEKVRAAARKHTTELFDVVKYTGPLFTEGQRGAKSKLANAAAPLVESLVKNVESIVDEVLSAETLDGVLSLKSHDNYTFEHSVEVTVLGAVLGNQLNLPLHDLRQLALGALLHDIGKLLISTQIINKPGPLSPNEVDVIKQHPQKGYEMVRTMLSEENVLARHVVWQHHERQDGAGYPRQLRGHNSIYYHRMHPFESGRILLIAEIAAVVDVYSALVSERPYRTGMEPQEVVSSLRQMAGNHLNREIVDVFLSILPMHPVGTEVVMISGELQGYRGMVVGINRSAINRPRIRVLFDPNGQNITPFEIDTSHNDDIQFAPAIMALKSA